VSGSGISWAICKSAPCSRQTPCQHPTTQFFTGRMPFLPPNQQRQSTEGCKHSLQFTVNKIVYKIFSAMSEDLYIEVSTHFGIESVENLIANHRNRFINRYSETDNYLCQMLRRLAGCCTWHLVAVLPVWDSALSICVWYCHVPGHWLSSGPWQESGPIGAFVVIPHQVGWLFNRWHLGSLDRSRHYYNGDSTRSWCV